MGKDKLSRIVWIELSKFIPNEARRLPRREIRDPALVAAFTRALADAPETEEYAENFSAPRYFVRLCGNNGTIIERGEVRRRHAIFSDEYLYTPGEEIWNLLESVEA